MNLSPLTILCASLLPAAAAPIYEAATKYLDWPMHWQK